MGRNKPSKALFLPALIVVSLALAACSESTQTIGPSTAAQTATPPRPTLTLAPRDLNLALEGEGSDILGPFTVNAGVMIAFVRYEGDDPFSMTFLGVEQEIVESIDSISGPYQGERVHSVFDGNDEGLAPGDYTVVIEGTGSWRLRLLQEKATRGQSPEINLSGSGDGGGSWLELDDGEYTMTSSHTGPADFTVELFDSQGRPPYRIVEATGSHQGERRFSVGGGEPEENPQAGFYAMGIRSQGDWEVSITSSDAP